LKSNNFSKPIFLLKKNHSVHACIYNSEKQRLIQKRKLTSLLVQYEITQKILDLIYRNKCMHVALAIEAGHCHHSTLLAKDLHLSWSYLCPKVQILVSFFQSKFLG